MNSSFIGKYKPAIILTLALTVFLASCISLPTTTPTPGWVVSTLAGSRIWGAGYQDATGTAAEFDKPAGVAVDSSGNVYVADAFNNRIRKITPAGEVTTLAGSGTEGYHDATGTAAQFNHPFGVAVDSDGIVYVADQVNHRIRKITSKGVVSTFAGSGTQGYHDATGTAAQFNYPHSVTVDSSGNLYVADTSNHRIRKITPDRVVTTIAGATAEFDFPYGVAVDSSGNLYVADTHNNCIRRITSAGVVSTLAGSGTAGDKDAFGTAAEFDHPHGVAVDSSGILYVADANNSRIRKIEYK